VPVLAQGIPDLRIVIDHLGKPPIVGRGFEPWGSLLARAARMPNVFAKMSGLDVGESDRWTAADIASYVDHALELFGPDRLMFGSDWPVAILRGGYAKVWHETNVALELQRTLVDTRKSSWFEPTQDHALKLLLSR
jgi:L-fuconolactonase